MEHRRRIWISCVGTGLLAVAGVSAGHGAPIETGPTSASIDGAARPGRLPPGEWLMLSGVGVLILFAHRRHGLC